jgi:hypothetical protein
MKTVAIKINGRYFRGGRNSPSLFLHDAQLFDADSSSFKFTIRNLKSMDVKHAVVTIGETEPLLDKLAYYQQEVIL